MNAKTLSALTAIAAVAAATSLAACEQKSPGTQSMSQSSPSTPAPATATQPPQSMAAASDTKAGGTQAGTPADDAALTAQVKTALLAEPALRSQTIDVDTRNATVTLSGAVDSAASKSKANEIAAGVNGVVAVVDHLTIKAS